MKRLKSEEEKWTEIGRIIREVQKVKHHHHTVGEYLSDVTVKPLTGIPLAIIIIFISFYIVRLIGEGLIGYVFDPLFNSYQPIVMDIYNWLDQEFLRNILIGNLIDGKIDYFQSMGLLTTAIYVPFAAVLPYIISFYFMLSLLEDVGYLPRLATLVDNIFHKMGMHGHAIVSVFLGLGCNVPGALSARILETRKQRFISSTLLAIAVPCMAQISMIFAIFAKLQSGFNYPPIVYISLVFITLTCLYFVAGFLLNKFVKGESPEIFLEIPPYRRPSMRTILKKTWMRMRWFLKDALPWLFMGVFLINILYFIGFIEFLGDVFSPIMEGIFALPGETAIVLIAGFLRKDLAVGLLLGLNAEFNPMQLVIIATILTIYFPCVATFSVLFKELGVKDLLKSTLIMIITAIIVGGIMRIILLGV